MFEVKKDPTVSHMVKFSSKEGFSIYETLKKLEVGQGFAIPDVDTFMDKQSARAAVQHASRKLGVTVTTKHDAKSKQLLIGRKS